MLELPGFRWWQFFIRTNYTDREYGFPSADYATPFFYMSFWECAKKVSMVIK